MKTTVIALAFIFLTIAAARCCAASNDTTYGPVQTVDKQQPPPEADPRHAEPPHDRSRHERHHDNDNDDNNDGDTSSLTGAGVGLIFKGIGYGLYYVYIKPVVEIAAGERDIDALLLKKSLSIDLANGFLLYPGIAAGFQLQADITGLYRFGSLGLGGKTGVRPALMGIWKDFQRNVYVNGSLIGAQRDVTSGYFNFQIPFQGSFHWFPAGESGAFNLYCGGGVACVYEGLDIERTTTYGTARENLHLSQWSWVPIGTVGIGRFVRGNETIGNFSLEYSLTANPYALQRPFPSDNTKYSHAFSLRWALVF
jgi:hypothetical protein